MSEAVYKRETVRLERVEFGIRGAIEESEFRSLQSLDVAVSMLGRSIVADIRWIIYGTKPNTERREMRLPKTWFDHWLHDHRESWLARFFRKPVYVTHVVEVVGRIIYPKFHADGEHVVLFKRRQFIESP